jgi:hypothetical protein
MLLPMLHTVSQECLPTIMFATQSDMVTCTDMMAILAHGKQHMTMFNRPRLRSLALIFGLQTTSGPVEMDHVSQKSLQAALVSVTVAWPRLCDALASQAEGSKTRASASAASWTRPGGATSAASSGSADAASADLHLHGTFWGTGF